MVRSVTVHGSIGEAMFPVPTRPGQFWQGKREDIVITGNYVDKDLPEEIFQGMRHLTISSVADKDRLVNRIGRGFSDLPNGCCVAFREDVACAAEEAGKTDLAAMIRGQHESDELDFFVFERGQYLITAVA
jgi:hypothetical protein